MLDMQLSRRRLLAGASAGAAAGMLASPVNAKAPMLNTQAPSFYRFKLGSPSSSPFRRRSPRIFRSSPTGR